MDSHRLRRAMAGALVMIMGTMVAPEARAQDAPPVLPPSPSPGPVERAQTEVTVRFEPTAPDTTLLGRSGVKLVLREDRRYTHIRYYKWAPEDAYSPLCEGPCETRLTTGEYKIALSHIGSDTAVPVVGKVEIDEPSVLHAELVDRSGLRLVGGIIGIGGLVTGMVMSAAALGGDVKGGLLAGGISTAVVSVVIWTISALQKDEARVTVTPLTSP